MKNKFFTALCIRVEDDPAGHQSSRTWPTFPWYTLYWHGEGPGIVSLCVAAAGQPNFWSWPHGARPENLGFGECNQGGWRCCPGCKWAWRGHPPPWLCCPRWWWWRGPIFKGWWGPLTPPAAPVTAMPPVQTYLTARTIIRFKPDTHSHHHHIVVGQSHYKFTFTWKIAILLFRDRSYTTLVHKKFNRYDRRIHKSFWSRDILWLRGHNFALFWQPIYSMLIFLTLNVNKNIHFWNNPPHLVLLPLVLQERYDLLDHRFLVPDCCDLDLPVLPHTSRTPVQCCAW